MTAKYTQVAGVGGYLPAQALSNTELAKRYDLDTSDEWITSRTGIQQRHIVSADENTTSMAVEAAQRALDFSGVSPQQIDMVVVATCTPDSCMPSVACQVQHALGLRTIPAFDINSACSGFIYAMSLADQYIRTGFCEHVLVIGSDASSRILDWSDRSTCVLFGDGAGAMILKSSDSPGIIGTHLSADGRLSHLLKTTPMLGEAANASPVCVHMQGQALFKQAVSVLGSLVDDTLKAHGLEQSDIDWLVPHQANLRIIKTTAQRLNLSMEQVIVTIDQHANTIAATIPLAFDKAVRDGRIQKGQTLLLEAFGAGLAWGSVLLSY